MDWVYILCGVALNAIVFGVWKPWGKGYGEEKGKNLARKEDLDKILAEVQAVTKTTKGTESKLAGDLWHQQQQWNKKAEIYATLLKALWNLHQAYVPLESAAGYKSIPGAEQHLIDIQGTIIKRQRDVVDAQVAISEIYSFARIFIKEECVNEIERHSEMTTDMPESPTVEWVKKERLRVRDLLHKVTDLAKLDLIPTQSKS